MNYKVTFYENAMQMLTERKANFVNNVKKLTSQIVGKLANECGRNGQTSGIAIFNRLKRMVIRDEKIWRCGITLDDYKNIKLDYLPNTGQPIPIKVQFNSTGENDSHSEFESSGHILPQEIGGKKFVSEVFLKLEFSLCLDDNPITAMKEMLNEIQTTLSHELAHAQDEFLMGEIKKYKDKGVSDEEMRYIIYWTKPTEIRSHMLEVIQRMNSKKYNNPNRTFRNMYKTSKATEEAGITQSDEDKETMRTTYSMLKKSYDSTSIDKKAMKAFHEVIDRAFHNSCPHLAKQFIIDYHIAFIEQYNPTMKQRFYDKLFPNTPTKSLDTLNGFLDAMKSVTRQITKIHKEISIDCRQAVLYNYPNMKQLQNKLNACTKLIENLWKENSPLAPAFENYNPKLLKKLGKEMVEQFENDWSDKK